MKCEMTLVQTISCMYCFNSPIKYKARVLDLIEKKNIYIFTRYIRLVH